MKEFHAWMADMANSIVDASEIKEEKCDRKDPPCMCDVCYHWYSGKPSAKDYDSNDDD